MVRQEIVVVQEFSQSVGQNPFKYVLHHVEKDDEPV